MNKFILICSILICTCFLSCEEKIKKAGYSGEELAGKASILRDKTTKAASLQIDTDSSWSLYAGRSVETIDFSKPIAAGESGGVFPLNVPTTERYYFELVTSEGRAILAERLLPMTGGYNYRDIGGYRTNDGRHVKWGKIFRSDDLCNLTDEDLIYLSSIPIISIVDFRELNEIRKLPDRIPYSVKENFIFHLISGNLSALINDGMEQKTAEEYTEKIKDKYKESVINPEALEQYKRSFNVLEIKQDIPVMFHCAAGKDRVGIAIALIMYALGVSHEDVMQDYLLSGVYLENKYKPITDKYPEVAPIFQAKEEYLNSVVEQIEKDHGSVENFLTTVLKVDLNLLRETYLDN
jgi:protein-tyrosine phosphatase